MGTTRHQENILHKHEKKNNSMKLLDWTNCNYILYRFIALFVHFHCLLGNVQQLLCGSTSSNEMGAKTLRLKNPFGYCHEMLVFWSGC